MHFKSSIIPHPQLKLVNKFGNLNSIKLFLIKGEYCVPFNSGHNFSLDKKGFISMHKLNPEVFLLGKSTLV